MISSTLRKSLHWHGPQVLLRPWLLAEIPVHTLIDAAGGRPLFVSDAAFLWLAIACPSRAPTLQRLRRALLPHPRMVIPQRALTGTLQSKRRTNRPELRVRPYVMASGEQMPVPASACIASSSANHMPATTNFAACCIQPQGPILVICQIQQLIGCNIFLVIPVQICQKLRLHTGKKELATAMFPLRAAFLNMRSLFHCRAPFCPRQTCTES